MLENEKNSSSLLTRGDDGCAINYDAQWDDDIHHCWHRLLTGENESYYSDFGGDTVERLGRCLSQGFDYQGEFSQNLGRTRGEPTKGLPPDAFVAFLQNHDQIGNRAKGERLTQLADPAKLSLARALFLLSPQIPLLFMGEDWGSKTPFQFFVDFSHDPSLSQAVREGRKKEFSSFKSFLDQTNPNEIPDPTALSTFTNSTLDWNETTASPYAAIAKETRHLLALRAEKIIPLMKSMFISSSYRKISDGALEVSWVFGEGRLDFSMNFGIEPLQVSKPQDDILWSNLESSALDLEGSTIELKPWTALVTKGSKA
jgi:maltooligosyltrehalose trehalohydrolase